MLPLQRTLLRLLIPLAACAAVVSQSACVEPLPGPDRDAIPIGALLPFTGDIAASGTNIERSIRMAIENFNEVGGVNGQDVRLVARDTHSELTKGLASERSLVVDDGVLGILGPENEDLAFAGIQQLIAPNQVVQISGGVTSPVFTVAADDGFFFRTAPSARSYGRVLAERMQADGVRRATVLYVGDAFGSGFASVLINEFTRLGIAAAVPTSFTLGERTYADTLRRLLAEDLDAIVLVGYPKSSATIVQEWALLGGAARWYLTPTLKTQDFIDNVPPGLLDGVIGASPTLSADASIFAAAFAERFDGDTPLDAAAFYYDATVLMLLALAQAEHLAGGLPDGPLVRDQVTDISRPGGSVVKWNDLEAALELIGQGLPLNYDGVSGSVDLDDRGDLSQAEVELWTIRNDKFVAM